MGRSFVRSALPELRDDFVEIGDHLRAAGAIVEQFANGAGDPVRLRVFLDEFGHDLAVGEHVRHPEMLDLDEHFARGIGERRHFVNEDEGHSKEGRFESRGAGSDNPHAAPLHGLGCLPDDDLHFA